MADEAHKPKPPQSGKRAWKGVLFPCCGVYGRIYQSIATGRFEGNCPKCGQPAKLGLWAIVILAFFLLNPLFLATPAFAADLAGSDSIASPTETNKTIVRKGLTPITEEEIAEVPATKDTTTKSMAQPTKAGKSSQGNILGKKTETRDSVRFSLFAQTGISFLDFADRKRFAQALDTMYREYLGDALNPKDSSRVKKQNFQNVNFCFPVYAGMEFRLTQGHHFAMGSGMIYDKETVILTDRTSSPHEVYYVIQAFPLFVEWRIGISPRLITLDGHERFSATLRYWWLLSGTEIYSNWGAVKAERGWKGQGWGFSLGYQLLEWRRIRIYGDLGLAMLHASSQDLWSNVVPDYTKNGAGKANWELGGIQLNLRANFGVLKE